MAEFREFYGDAQLYDVVFDRPVDSDLDFIEAVFSRIHRKPLESFLEVACGPGYHARRMGQRGKRSFGFDLEEGMVQFARAEADRVGSIAEFECHDMRSFSSTEEFDVAVAMLDGIDSLETYQDLAAHFKSIAAVLVKDGVYFLDNMHPRDVNVWKYDPVVYEGRKNGRFVRISYGYSPPAIDPISQVAISDAEVTVTENGDHRTFYTQARERFITVQEIVAICTATNTFDLYGVWGAFDLETAFDDPAADRMLIVLKAK